MRYPLLVSLLFVGGCATTKPVAVELTPDAIRQLVDKYVDATLREQPDLARELGLHDNDGKIASVGANAAVAKIARARAYLNALDTVQVKTLDDPLRLDVQLTQLHAKQTAFALGTLRQHESIMFYTGLFDVSGYLIRDYAPLDQRVKSMLDHAAAATGSVDVMLASLRNPQVKTHVETARKAFAGLVEYYEGDVRTLSQGALDADPALLARFEVVTTQAVEALKRIIAWIDLAIPEANNAYALGESNFLEMLAVNEGLVITMDDLEAMAEEDYRRNFDAFAQTAQVIAPNKTTAEVAKMVADEKLPNDKVLSTARDQMTGLLEFIERKKIITIGSKDTATVEVTPPFMRWNFAFLNMVGPFEKAKGSFYYISPPDPSWPKATQQAYLPYEADLLATSIHEVYPGHFVQALQLARAPSRASKIFGSYAFIEGWAHYTEQMMMDEGYGNGDPKLRLGQLSNALLRNCRFLAAIGLHTRGMSVAEADELFQKKCFIDPGNATQQAYRGTFDPGYLSYTLGKLQIHALREKFFAKKGAIGIGAFHDWLLSYGSAPVALAAERL